MIIIGAIAFMAAFAVYALLIAGLFLLSRWIAARHDADPDLPLHGLVQSAIGAVILALVLAPVMFCVLYLPLHHVSSDGTRELGVIKPRLVEDMGTAALISFATGSVLAVLGVSIFSFTRSKSARN